MQKIFLVNNPVEDISEESKKQADKEINLSSTDHDDVKLDLGSNYTILKPEAVQDIFNKSEEEKKRIEDDLSINASEFRKLPKSHNVKFFTLVKASDYDNIATELYRQDMIGLVNINPLKQHSTPMVVRVLNKFKELTQEIDGDIGALRNGWIIVTPKNVQVYRKNEASQINLNT